MSEKKMTRRAFLTMAGVSGVAMILASCAPKPTPTPTPAPTKPAPTAAPKAEPTKAPTAVPTAAPTAAPTKPQPTATPVPKPTDTKPAPKLAGNIRGVFWTAQVENGLKKAAEEYMKMHPGTKVEIEIRPWEGFEDWLTTQLVGGTAPEVAQSHGWNEHYARGLAIRYNEYLEKPSPYSTSPRWADDFLGGLIERYSSPKQDYCMVPLDSVDNGIYYNKTIFDKLGLKPPTTWTEWFKVNDELKKNNFAPIGVDGAKPNYSFFHWGLRIVGDLLQAHKYAKLNARPRDENWPKDKVMTDPIATAREGMLDGEEIILAFRAGDLDPTKAPEFAYAYEAFREFLNKYAQPGWQSTDAKSNTESFLQQKIVTIFAQTTQLKPWQKDIASMPKDKQFEFSTFLYPNFDPAFSKDIPMPKWSSRSTGGMGVKIGIPKPKTEEIKALAIDFVQWLTSPKGNQIVMDNADPIGPAVIKGVVVKGFEAWGKSLGTAVCGNIADTLPQDPEGTNAWKDASQEYFSGKMDTKAFLEKFKALCNEAHTRAIAKYKWDLDLKTIE
jgi:ABC-type glycerol-3-phosphate transport system substrate-binding protein